MRYYTDTMFDSSEEEKLRESISFLDEEIDELKKENRKLNKICLFYSEEIYRFISNFRRDNLDPKQLNSLSILQSIADSCIKDPNYKRRLQTTYIDKKLASDKSIQKSIEDTNKDFMEEALTDDSYDNKDDEGLWIK